MKPNILWITTDRQRFDTLGAYGNAWVHTPNLDALAQNGVLFEQAYCQSPICSPSRASFMTGRYPRTARLSRNGQTIPADERMASRLFADAGYVCGHAGKMHLSACAPAAAHWCEQRIDDGYSFYQWSMHHNNTEMSPYAAWLEGQGVEYQAEPVHGSPWVQFGLPSRFSNVSWIADQVVGFIRGNVKVKKPWFCTMGIEDPHNPFDPPREYLERYLPRLGDIPLPNYAPGELDDKPMFQRIDHDGAWGSGKGHFAYSGMSDDDHRLLRAAYWAQNDHIDVCVGRVLDTLRDTGQFDNTFVVFHSDHGEMLGDHGIYFQGAYFYPEMIHVPLLMHWPNGLNQNRPRCSCSDLIELVDVAPTLLQAAGMPAYAGMQGRSLWPWLTGENATPDTREDVYAEYYQAIPYGYKATGGAYATALRSHDYALTVVHERDEGELYDLRRDPGETRNVWNLPDYADVQMRLLKRLCDRMAATIDPLPPVRAGY